MKKYLLYAALLLMSVFATAQAGVDEKSGESVSIGVYTSPGSWDDGFNIGASLEYTPAKFAYLRVDGFAAPNLQANNELALDYYSIGGAVGLQYEFNLFNEFDGLKVFAGMREGLIYREGGGLNYAYLGGEIGIQYTLPSGWFLRGIALTESATDSKLWSTDDTHSRNSVYCSIGYRFW